MAGPFKMKGSPMKRNFGIGASPVKQTEEKKKGTYTWRDAPGKTYAEQVLNAKLLNKSMRSKKENPRGAGPGEKRASILTGAGYKYPEKRKRGKKKE